MEKVVVILGPTATGKSDLGVKLAKKFDGEIISADSRQVYRGLDLGSGKITTDEMLGIPHHLIDIASPKRVYSVAQYQKAALKAIRKIHTRGKSAFLVGGSPQYLYSVIDGTIFPDVKPNSSLRKELEKLDTYTLYKKLQSLDPKRASIIESKNKRRLIRALEIINETGEPVPLLKAEQNLYIFLLIGIGYTFKDLKKKISKRLSKRLTHGMIEEVSNLRKSGLSWKRLESFGLEYRYIAQYLENKISKDEMISQIQIESEHFVKRQMNWFKKDSRIKWIDNAKEATKIVKEFLL